jgi:hypothetical protein
MNRRQIAQLARLGFAMPGRLRRTVTLESATARLTRQLADRADTFLACARRQIYDHPSSPYRALLLHAGCDHAGLSRCVRARGLEATLSDLAARGVRVSLEEFKRQRPIERGSLRLAPREADFDNPGLAADGITGSTSGSRAAPTRVMYDWEFIAEEAAHERLLYEEHGLFAAPWALWYPALPGVAGIHNLLMSLQCGRPPERWFSQLDPSSRSVTAMDRMATLGIRIGATLAGMRAPAPERADPARPEAVLDWARRHLAAGRPIVLRTFASSAVKLAEHARREGFGLAGLTIFTGGEPLTEARRRFIEGTGARAFPRYVATEAGLIAAACPHRASTDDMHVYTDRLALIRGEDGDGPTPLLLTTLTPDAGKVLVNTEMGDVGALARRPCDCGFGAIGFDLFVSGVASRERLTLEGMTVPVRSVDAAVASVVESLGGSPDAWQHRVTSDAAGITRLTVKLRPDLGVLDEPAVLAAILARLATAGPGLDVAADLWRQAGTLQIVREAPVPTAGAKLPGHAASPPAGR